MIFKRITGEKPEETRWIDAPSPSRLNPAVVDLSVNHHLSDTNGANILLNHVVLHIADNRCRNNRNNHKISWT